MKVVKIEPNQLSEKTKASMKTRIITALVMTAIVLPCLIFGGWFFFALSLIITIIASYELVHTIGLKTKVKYFIYIATLILLLSSVYWIMFKSNYQDGQIVSGDTFLPNGFKTLFISPSLILVMAGVFFGISFISEEFSTKNVVYLIAMIIVVGLCLQSLLYLRFAPINAFSNIDGFDVTSAVFKYAQSMFLIIYVILGTIANDIGAYFVGVLFGKHKLNERVSPNKTIEGFVGGIVFSLIISSTFAFIVSACNMPMMPNLDLSHWYWIVIISVVMPFIANIGDFTFSIIKRSYGIKDFSNILPGHGGILDRIDSLLFVSGFVSIMVLFINNGWNFFI